MSEPAKEKETPRSDDVVIRLRDRVDRQQVSSVWREAAKAVRPARGGRLILDFEEVTRIDTAGVALVRQLEKKCADTGVEFALLHLPEDVDQFLRYTREHSSGHEQPPRPPSSGWIPKLGGWALERLEGLNLLVRFIGDFSMAVLKVFRKPSRRLRLNETFYHLQLVGAEAIPLVGALSALMGMIMVFQGTLTMENFGARIYIADMVAIAVTREMAPLLTAVIVAGRSGAAFAAEIGSMKLNQEIDALEVMGFDIAGFLVLPRVLALTIAGPLLTLFADGAGILGGLLTSHMILDLSVESFFYEIRKTLTPPDIYTGIIKGLTFAALIGLTGCYCGLRTRMTAGSVGVQTTAAVVVGILLIIMADGFFAGIFQLYGW